MKPDARCALITGAGSGIGRALAIEAARRGMNVALVGRKQNALLETQRLFDEPGKGLVIVADITDATDRATVRQKTGAAFGHLDLLINNAGVQHIGALAKMGDEQMLAMMQTNLLAPMALTRDMLDLLTAASPSRIINVGSMFGHIGFPLFSVYSATKFGLRGFSDTLRRELKDVGITVTYAAPRATRTATTDRTADVVKAFEMVMDAPEAVAGRIMLAAEKGAHTVYPKGPERFFAFLQYLMPGVIDRAITGQFHKARSALTASPER